MLDLGPAPSHLPAPRLESLRADDLTSRVVLRAVVARGLLLDSEANFLAFQLHGQAVARGLVTGSEADRLRLVASAEHALAIGKGNPAGLFVYLLRGKLWRYLTQVDKDGANRRIKAFLKGPEKSVMGAMFPLGLEKPVRGTSCRPPVRAALSEDARAVVRVRSALAAKGYRGDPFPQVRRHDPSWTRDRWDRALAELGP